MAIPDFNLTGLLKNQKKELRGLKETQCFYSKPWGDEYKSKDALLVSFLSDNDKEMEFARNTLNKLRYYKNEYALKQENLIVLLRNQVSTGEDEIERLSFQNLVLQEELENNQVLLGELQICLKSCAKEIDSYRERDEYLAKQGTCSNESHREHDTQLAELKKLQISYLRNLKKTHAGEIRERNDLIRESKTRNERLQEEIRYWKSETGKKTNELILAKSAEFKAEELLKSQLKVSRFTSEEETRDTSKLQNKIHSAREDYNLPEYYRKNNFYNEVSTLKEKTKRRDREIVRLKKAISEIRADTDKDHEQKEFIRGISNELLSYNIERQLSAVNSPHRRRNGVKSRDQLVAELQRHRSNPREYSTQL